MISRLIAALSLVLVFAFTANAQTPPDKPPMLPPVKFDAPPPVLPDPTLNEPATKNETKAVLLAIEHLRKQMNTRFDNLETANNKQFADLKNEVAKSHAALDTKIENLRTEVGELRTEMRTEFGLIKNELGQIKAGQATFQSQMTVSITNIQEVQAKMLADAKKHREQPINVNVNVTNPNPTPPATVVQPLYVYPTYAPYCPYPYNYPAYTYPSTFYSDYYYSRGWYGWNWSYWRTRTITTYSLLPG